MFLSLPRRDHSAEVNDKCSFFFLLQNLFLHGVSAEPLLAEDV